jgi:hypothetical protein
MENQEALQWFVDFANMDLEAIKPGDKAKLLVEAEEYLFFKSEMEELKKRIPISKRAIGPVLAWVLKIPPKESDEYWPTILHLQKVVREHFLNFMVSAPYIVSYGHQTVLTRIVWGSKLPFTITYFPATESPDEYVCFKIFMLLEGFPGHALRRCPGCEKFFFNPTRRKKAFCSPKCMWRMIAGKRRKELKENHPKKYEAYLKKQREIMSQKYEKEKKAELGPNVKIQRKRKSKFSKK